MVLRPDATRIRQAIPPKHQLLLFLRSALQHVSTPNARHNFSRGGDSQSESARRQLGAHVCREVDRPDAGAESVGDGRVARRDEGRQVRDIRSVVRPRAEHTALGFTAWER